MADEDLLRRIHELEDLDLAALLCLISREHCIVSTEPAELDDLVEELRLVASQTFHLSSTVVDCTPYTTLDDLAASIQLHPPAPPPPPTPKPQQQLRTPTPRTPSASPLRRRGTESSYFRGSPVVGNTTTGPSTTGIPSTPSHSHGHGHQYSSAAPHPHPPPQIANVILAKNLDRAPKDVQIQCLELLRTRRILTRTSVQTAPKQFLFVAVLESGGAARLVPHLNDLFYVSHWHDPEDGFAHLEEEEAQERYRSGGGGGDRGNDDNEGDRRGAETDSSASASSVVVRRSVITDPQTPSTPRVSRTRSTHTNPHPQKGDQASTYSASITSSRAPFPSLADADIASLALLSRNVNMSVEVLRYLMNIVSFLRMHRAVAPGGGGVTPQATKHFEALAKSLAALHGLDYVTPSLVGLAAKKTYAHRVRIAAPAEERSLQWGSELGAVEALLEGVDAEYVIEDVLGMVEAPL
ncbi:uncharacterized protein F4807DRAFT_403928 [Annulohypoxylon truncatum]|uniref:uncharacterized protein n=1 Tax=Annulohypoxylon truncatum TaxID=327061 RepID=UPI00200846D2|nr:uncharacterized protein F4807DRAFT_403928 [Annulohypoxylon truncatum]KAI1214596.1 hypothetical protein F4807DRAFT_403928 [Annulohypoxylon truncatum]